MRMHENRALFVKAQQNAQRRMLDELLTNCPKHIADRLLAARQVPFPATYEFIKRHLPVSDNSSGAEIMRYDSYQFSEVTDPIKALKQIEDAVALFPDSELFLSLGELGGMSFCDEHFVDLALPMFAARPSHWNGVWQELFDLGEHCMSVIAEDGSFGIIVNGSSGWDVCGNVFEIGRWNESQEANKTRHSNPH